MAYAGERAILDADSHVMELADFLDEFIESDVRDRLRRQGLEALRPVLEDAQYKAERRRTDPAIAAQAEEHLLDDKGWTAMGGFDPNERSRALDLLGFEGQLVFATFATAMFSLPRNPRRYDDAAVRVGPSMFRPGPRGLRSRSRRLRSPNPLEHETITKVALGTSQSH